MFDCLSLPWREGHHGSLWTLHCDWLSSLHVSGTLISMWIIMAWAWACHPTPAQEEPCLGCSISLFLFSLNPPSPPAKNRTFFLYFSFCFWDEFYFLWKVLPFDFIFKSIVILDIGGRDFPKKKIIIIMQKRKKSEWAQYQSFQNKNWCFFQNWLHGVFFVHYISHSSKQNVTTCFSFVVDIQVVQCVLISKYVKCLL